MATTTEEVMLTATSQEQVNLEKDFEGFVKIATWKELLIDLVNTNKLDPWNIDLIKVVDGYVSVVKKMKVLDLRVPANIILAASVLLRMKSESFRVFEIEEPHDDAVETAAMERIRPEVPELVPRLRLQPNKRVTLMELMAALDEVIKIKEKRELLVQASETPVSFYVDKEDIDEKIERTFSVIVENADGTGLTTFAYLANKFSHQDSILTGLFVPLLFLAHKQRVIIMQEKFFDEIFIKLNDGKNAGPADKPGVQEANRSRAVRNK